MIQVLTIALWSHLFCGAWSRPGKVFGWLSNWVYNNAPEWIYTPLIGCATCHAVWIATFYNIYLLSKGGIFDFGTCLSVLCASFLAYLLDDFEEIRDKWKNS